MIRLPSFLVRRGSQGLVPIDAAFLFPGMFVEQEIYVKIDKDQYVLFCKNTEITPAIHEKLARILSGSDHMIYVSEGDAAVLAEQSDAVFMEHEMPENRSEIPVELMLEETEKPSSGVRD